MTGPRPRAPLRASLRALSKLGTRLALAAPLILGALPAARATVAPPAAQDPPAAPAAPQDPAAEQPADAPSGATLVIGTKQAAPFSFREEGGDWRGLSIELWEAAAGDLGLDYRYAELPLEELVSGLVDERLDASVAALTVTAAREERVDFTHPYLPSGLGIAVPRVVEGGWLSAARRLLSAGFLQAVGTLLVVLFLAGAVLWTLERRKNPEQFGGTAGEGLASAFWWSAVTMTTVGYGDKAPVTRAGRAVAVIWMFASVITISSLTAAIASTLTVSRLDTGISGPDDLDDAGRVACVADSTGEAWLREQRLAFRAFPTAEEALAALAEQRADAVVYDAPILQHLARTAFDGAVAVLPVTFERQDYALALPLDSPLRKDLNTALLEVLSSPRWNELLDEYLGTRP